MANPTIGLGLADWPVLPVSRPAQMLAVPPEFVQDILSLRFNIPETPKTVDPQREEYDENRSVDRVGSM